jgi:hypothetical protein
MAAAFFGWPQAFLDNIIGVICASGRGMVDLPADSGGCVALGL